MGRRTQAVSDLFDQKASGWTQAYKPGGALKQRARLFVEEIATLRPPPGGLLDLGCGTGHVAKALADRGYRVHGFDVSPAMLAEAKRLFGESMELTVLAPDWSSLPCPDASFDVALASSVLEYVDDPAAILGDLARVLRPGGILVLTVPNMRHPRRWLEGLLACGLRLPMASLVADRIPRVALYARFLRTSRTRYSRAGWIRRFEAAGFFVKRIGAATSPLLQLFSLERRSS